MANSTYALSGRLEVGIQINGTDFPLDTFNLLNFLQIGWTTRTNLPTCHFAISDVRHTLDNLSLQDGIPLTITIAPYGQATTTYNFRKFNHVKTFNGQCFQYEIDGYLDNPLFWTGTVTAGFTGTSGDLMSSVASKCGMTYDGVQTADSQLWLPRNRTYGEWTSFVVPRGYIDDSSCMVAGVDPTGAGKLIYKNVTNLPDPTVTVVFGQQVSGSLTCSNYAPAASSGMGNKFQGYQHTRYGQSMTSATPSTAMSQMTFTPDVSGYYLNTDISQQIGQGYRTFGGIDVGNTHEKYDQAIYQNRRLASLYSLGVEFLMMSPSSLTLLDKFTFQVDNETQKQDLPYAGTYTIGAKALFIQGGTYAEKLLGIRMGTMQPYVAA